VTSVADEAKALDAEILRTIDAWHRKGTELSDDAFNALALRIFRYQLATNAPYARYCETHGVTLDSMPADWEGIPAIPTQAFKEAALATFDVGAPHDGLMFETSGTTAGTGGKHYIENPKLYEASLLASFDHFMLPDHIRLRYLSLIPHPSLKPHSSLGYMAACIAKMRGDGKDAWYIGADGTLNVDAFVADMQSAIEHDRPVCVLTTAFSLVHVLDALDERHLYFALPNGSRFMETGGFKGRARAVERGDLYYRTCERFGATLGSVVAEYGMTELTSQYYDVVLWQGLLERHTEPRYKSAPPWLRARVVGPDGATLENGTVGALVHVDLANRSSCLAIQTEDLGVQFAEGLILIGREQGAELRGCSLTAEDLVVR
jgi:hypothetical protein